LLLLPVTSATRDTLGGRNDPDGAADAGGEDRISLGWGEKPPLSPALRKTELEGTKEAKGGLLPNKYCRVSRWDLTHLICGGKLLNFPSFTLLWLEAKSNPSPREDNATPHTPCQNPPVSGL